MRKLTFLNKRTKEKYDLGQDVTLLSEFINISKCFDYLIYEATMTGKEFIDFISEKRLIEVVSKKMDINKIVDNEIYLITVYDD